MSSDGNGNGAAQRSVMMMEMKKDKRSILIKAIMISASKARKWTKLSTLNSP